MKQFHSWDVDQLENMYVFERDIYTEMLKQHLAEEQERLQRQNRK